jgi:hypothetical protein
VPDGDFFCPRCRTIEDPIGLDPGPSSGPSQPPPPDPSCYVCLVTIGDSPHVTCTNSPAHAAHLDCLNYRKAPSSHAWLCGPCRIRSAQGRRKRPTSEADDISASVTEPGPSSSSPAISLSHPLHAGPSSSETPPPSALLAPPSPEPHNSEDMQPLPPKRPRFHSSPPSARPLRRPRSPSRSSSPLRSRRRTHGPPSFCPVCPPTAFLVF